MDSNLTHVGLDKQEFRDFIGLHLIKLFLVEINLNKPYTAYQYDGDFLGCAIKNKEGEITFHQQHLKILKDRKVILELMKVFGWDEYDVSDYVRKNVEYDRWMNFIGTEEEHELFISKFSK